MAVIANLRVGAKLGVLVGAFGICLIVCGLLSRSIISTVRVGGPLYDDIVLGKDLVADILPPPEYVIESYLVALQMLGDKGSGIDALAKRMETLEKDYGTRHEVWVESLPAGPLREAMIETSYKPAMEFYRIYRTDFLPAIRAGERDKASSIAFGDLAHAYETHRAAIDTAVQLANERNAGTESAAQSLIAGRMAWLYGMVVVFLGVAAWLG